MSRIIKSFNKNWVYIDCFKDEYISNSFDDSKFEKVMLPHMNKEIPYNYFDEKMYQFVSCYRNHFNLDSKYKGKKVFIDFGGVMTYAKVYLNAHYLGEYKGGYTNFSFDLTPYLKFEEENVLTVMVDSTEREDIPPFGFVVDYLTYGGIYREVELRIVENAFIENIFAKPTKVLNKEKELCTDVYLVNEDKNNKDFTVKVSLEDLDGNSIKEVSKEISINTNENKKLELTMDGLSDIKLWDINQPNLYNVKVELTCDNQCIDTYENRIGFRKAEFTSDGFYLNGEKIKITGLNRHQSFPYVGYAMPKRAQIKDADILKYDVNLNLVRTSHYPQSKHFLNRCDEIGLLVFEEIPGWQHIGNKEWQEVSCNNVKEMIKRDWNHPSIILWGVRINESKDDHDFYLETNKIAHELDPTRQTGGVRCLNNSELLEDVYTMNDFIHEGKEIVLRDQKEITGLNENVPYLVTEYNGHMYPTKRFDQEERLNEHVLRHVRIQNQSALDDHISGAIGWCAFDYNTHYQFGAGDRICYHGVMDMFRIPKFAAHVYKSQVSPQVEPVLEPVTLWTRGERNGGGIVPLTILTNCDKVVVMQDGKIGKEAYPNRDKFKGLEHPPIILEDIADIGGWGAGWGDVSFVGYIDNKEVIRKNYSKNSLATKLVAEIDDTILEAGDMDVTRIVFKITDQCGNIIPFINEILELDVEGMGKQIGPDKTVLIGGCIAVWIKTTGEVGEITIKARCTRFEADKLTIKVQ